VGSYFLIKNDLESMSKNILPELILPQWPAPVTVKAVSTTRTGGYSQTPYDSFNLADHVGDQNARVANNRSLLAKLLPAEPVWLNQIHSNHILDAAMAQNHRTTNISHTNIRDADIHDADGSYTVKSNIVLVVMTADCLPVLVCNKQGTGIAALHAGWRGLAEGIVEKGVQQLMQLTQSCPEEMLIWLGPAIGPQAFEVGNNVRECFMQQNQTSQYSFIPASTPGKWLADIYKLAELSLSQLGVENIYGGDYCTYKEEARFFSYRRDGKTGRMASLIWIE
jgi:YfiH family protein